MKYNFLIGCFLISVHPIIIGYFQSRVSFIYRVF